MTDIVERLRKAGLRDGFAVILYQHVQQAADEIERLRIENWQLKGALGYAVPGDIPDNGLFKCGLCDAKTNSLIEAEAEIEHLRKQSLAPSISWNGYLVSGAQKSVDEVCRLIALEDRGHK